MDLTIMSTVSTVIVYGPPYHCPLCSYLWDTARSYKEHRAICKQLDHSTFDDRATYYNGNDNVAPNGRCPMRRTSGDLEGQMCLHRTPCPYHVNIHDPQPFPQFMPYPQQQQQQQQQQTSASNITKFSIAPISSSSSSTNPSITPLAPPPVDGCIALQLSCYDMRKNI